MSQQQFLTRKEWTVRLTEICDANKRLPPDERKEVIRDIPHVIDEIYKKRFSTMDDFDGFVCKRVFTVLSQSKIKGLQQLLETPKIELKKIVGCGDAVIKDLEYFLDDMGFELR